MSGGSLSLERLGYSIMQSLQDAILMVGTETG